MELARPLDPPPPAPTSGLTALRLQRKLTVEEAAKRAAPWKVTVDVLNGDGDINYTRQLADRVGSFGYRLGHVTKAGRFNYQRTFVYFEPGGVELAKRLATQLGCGTVSPLPGGRNARRLVVIAGPPSAAC